jgi:hypothetical protein
VPACTCGSVAGTFNKCDHKIRYESQAQQRRIERHASRKKDEHAHGDKECNEIILEGAACGAAEVE